MKSRWHEVFRSLQGEAGAEPPSLAVQGAAALLSSLYALGARGRRQLYDQGWLKPRRLPCQVLSIGNLEVGGVGKTPMTAFLAQRSQAAGRRVTIVSRGYGGRLPGVNLISDGRRILRRPPEAGDEACLLAEKLPGIPVITGGDRYAAGLQAWKLFRPDLIILDDGFQHFQLHRDLDVVLLDAGRPFGNGRLLPAGPLREPVNTLRRPLVLILTRYLADRHEGVWQTVRASFPAAAVLRAAFRSGSALVQPGGRKVSLESLAGAKLAAMAGLARPGSFAASLREMGIALQDFFTFPDHHAYTAADLAGVIAAAQQSGADGLVTTEKDWVKLVDLWPGIIPVYVVSLEVSLLDPWPGELFPLSLCETESP